MPTFIIPYNGVDYKIHESITYVTPKNIDDINNWIKDISVGNVVDDDLTIKRGKLRQEVKVKSSINQKTYTYAIDTPVELFTEKGEESETKLFLPSLPEGSLRGGRRQTNRKMRKNRRTKSRK